MNETMDQATLEIVDPMDRVILEIMERFADRCRRFDWEAVRFTLEKCPWAVVAPERRHRMPLAYYPAITGRHEILDCMLGAILRIQEQPNLRDLKKNDMYNAVFRGRGKRSSGLPDVNNVIESHVDSFVFLLEHLPDPLNMGYMGTFPVPKKGKRCSPLLPPRSSSSSSLSFLPHLSVTHP